MKRWTIAACALLALGVALFLFHRERGPEGQRALPKHEVADPKVVLDSSEPGARPPPADAAATTPPVLPRPADQASDATSSGILVQGMLRDQHGKPAENAFLRWVERGGEAHTSIGTHGAYSIAGLRPGRYTVELRGEDYRWEELDVEIAAQPEVQTRDFVLHPGMRFPIRIVDAQGATPLGPGRTDATQRAWSLTVHATRNQPASTMRALNAGSNQNSECGRFLPRRYVEPGHENLGLDVLGLLTLTEAPPLFISLAFGSTLVATQRIEKVPQELVFTIDPETLQALLATLRARLVEADGRTPRSGASVTLFCPVRNWSAKSDQEGRVELKDLLPGEYEFWEGTDLTQSHRVILTPGQALDLGDLVLREGPSQHVRIEFPGSLRPEVAFVVEPVEPGNPLGTLDRPLGSVRSSRFADRVAIPFPGPGSFELRIVMVGSSRERESIHLGALPQRIVFGDTPGEDVVVKLEETTTVALIPPRDPPPGVRWLVSTPDGRPAMLVRIEGRQPKLVELPQGSYSIAPVSDEPGFLDLIEPQKFTVGTSTVAVELNL